MASFSQETTLCSKCDHLPPDTRFPAHIAERFTLIGICQLLGVVCKARQFQAQFAMREETNSDRFFATAGRTAKELGQGQKLSQRVSALLWGEA
jgi:hypothetical protein